MKRLLALAVLAASPAFGQAVVDEPAPFKAANEFRFINPRTLAPIFKIDTLNKAITLGDSVTFAGLTAAALTPGATTAPGCASQALVTDSSGVIQCPTPTNVSALLRKQRTIFTDLEGVPFANTLAPFNTSLIASGTTPLTGLPARPGIATITSSTSANSGATFYAFCCTGILLGGGEHFEFAFQPQRFTNVTLKAGFIDNFNALTVVDGAFFSMDTSGVLSGVTSSNSSPTSTGTTFQLVLATWYRGAIQVNASAASVTFTLYSAADAVLWTDTVATNIPTAVGRETSIEVGATDSGTGTAHALVDIDWIYFSTGPLAR